MGLNTLQVHMLLEKAKETLLRTYSELRNLPKHQVTLDYISVENVIANSQQLYEFNPNAQNTQDTLPSRRLLRNDSFVAALGALTLSRRDRSKPGVEELVSFPCPVTFPAAAGFDPADLQAFYRGTLKYEVDNQIVVQGIDTGIFNIVPETQRITSNATPPAIDAPRYNQNVEYGQYIALPARAIIDGEQTTKFTLQLPPSALQVASVAAGVDHVVTLRLMGWTIKGVNLNKNVK